ncbi:MAG: ARPP-2 domain-containing protein, partial [Planktothrix sp.]
AQTRRVYLLSQLAKHDWNLEITARELGQSKDELVLRMEKAGFGYLLKQNLLEVARKNQKKVRR